MSVLIETTSGTFTVDLFVDAAPQACKNFLKLCKIKYYNGCLVFNVQQDYVLQSGDPTGTGKGGDSVNGLLYGAQARFFDSEFTPALRHTKKGLLSFARTLPGTANTNASQFIITSRDDCAALDDVHTIFGEVVDGWDTLGRINSSFCDDAGRPYVDVRIRHTYILLDPFDDPPGLDTLMPSGGVSPLTARPASEVVPVRLSAEEEEEARVVADSAAAQVALAEQVAAAEAHNKAVVLEMIGDLPDADVAPPDNVLFVCKLNPVTRGEDLEVLFARFGDVVSCDVIRDRDTGASLSYGFVEYASPAECEAAYFKMNGVVVDDRRIKVDFSQSVSRLWNQYRRQGKRGAVAAARALSASATHSAVGTAAKPAALSRAAVDPGAATRVRQALHLHAPSASASAAATSAGGTAPKPSSSSSGRWGGAVPVGGASSHDSAAARCRSRSRSRERPQARGEEDREFARSDGGRHGAWRACDEVAGRHGAHGGRHLDAGHRASELDARDGDRRRDYREEDARRPYRR